ncbi:hypothetical protein VaNZ11_016908 [Volvox africanus]|uniref:Uncharacterized protein n=1 Tax=Volvox africanus TaxID=51714 RepID=A0ABQ5SPQ1_9CHLO|nr:hypothetical protein VaNZ11_016908 [Volvox africanus]
MASDNEQAILQKLFELVKKEGEAVQKRLDQLETNFTDLKKVVQAAATSFTDLKKEVQAVQHTLGSLVERNIRKTIGELQGQDYAQELTLFSLEDLVRVVLEAQEAKPPTANDLLRACTELAEELQCRGIPQHFLKHLYEVIMNVEGNDPGMTELKSSVAASGWDGSADVVKLKAVLQKLQSYAVASTSTSGAASSKAHIPLRDTLGWLIQYLAMDTPEQQQHFLLSLTQKGSLGIAMAVHGAHAASFRDTLIDYGNINVPCVKKYDEVPLLSARIQMDVRGHVEVCAWLGQHGTWTGSSCVNVTASQRSRPERGLASPVKSIELPSHPTCK